MLERAVATMSAVLEQADLANATDVEAPPAPPLPPAPAPPLPRAATPPLPAPPPRLSRAPPHRLSRAPVPRVATNCCGMSTASRVPYLQHGRCLMLRHACRLARPARNGKALPGFGPCGSWGPWADVGAATDEATPHAGSLALPHRTAPAAAQEPAVVSRCFRPVDIRVGDVRVGDESAMSESVTAHGGRVRDGVGTRTAACGCAASARVQAHSRWSKETRAQGAARVTVHGRSGHGRARGPARPSGHGQLAGPRVRVGVTTARVRRRRSRETGFVLSRDCRCG